MCFSTHYIYLQLPDSSSDQQCWALAPVAGIHQWQSAFGSFVEQSLFVVLLAQRGNGRPFYDGGNNTKDLERRCLKKRVRIASLTLKNASWMR